MAVGLFVAPRPLFDTFGVVMPAAAAVELAGPVPPALPRPPLPFPPDVLPPPRAACLPLRPGAAAAGGCLPAVDSNDMAGSISSTGAPMTM